MINFCFFCYQDKSDWTICESLKSRIDTFKRTMPLIQDLKNPAMRDRHWQQLKQEVQKPFDHTSKMRAEEAVRLVRQSTF